MNRFTKLLALATIAAALAAAGCGDDDDETTTTTAPTTEATGALTLDQWTTQADAICSEGDRAQQQTAAQRFGDQPPSQAELEDFGATVVVPNLQAQHDAIAALPPPEAEADQIDAMLNALQVGIDEIAGDPGLLVQGTDSIAGIQEATALAQDLGLTDCGAG